jgi:hypothetical protein
MNPLYAYLLSSVLLAIAGVVMLRQAFSSLAENDRSSFQNLVRGKLSSRISLILLIVGLLITFLPLPQVPRIRMATLVEFCAFVFLVGAQWQAIADIECSSKDRSRYRAGWFAFAAGTSAVFIGTAFGMHG